MLNCYDLTILYLLSDAENALKKGSPFSALSLILACISECACVEYPNEWFAKNAEEDEYMKTHFQEKFNQDGTYKYQHCNNHDRERFVMFVDNYQSSQDVRQMDDGTFPCLDGDVLYQIRCALLHNGSNNVEFNTPKIKDDSNKKIQDFVFVLESDVSSSSMGSFGTSLKISVNQIVGFYASCVRTYIENHPNKISRFKTVKVCNF